MTLKLNAPALLRLRLPAFQRVNLTLVGCGGTGSHIASGLVALAQALQERDQHMELLFVDPDHVEPKNVGRQLFAAGNVGRAKATVLAVRLSAAFGLGVMSAVRPIDARDTFLHPDAGALNIVIGAVDNKPARALIAAAVAAAQGRLWWLDAGNEDHSGQVALGNRTQAAQLKGTVGLDMLADLPAVSVLYPDLVAMPKPIKLIKVKGRKPKAANCADAVAAGEQGLMVNRMAAGWALAMLHDLLLGELKYFALAFDLQFGGTRPYALDLATLEQVTGLPAAQLRAAKKGK